MFLHLSHYFLEIPTTGGAAAQDVDPETARELLTSPNNRPFVALNRLSGFDYPCRVQYRVMLGDARSRGEDSGLLDQISDLGGRIRGFQMRYPLCELLRNSTVLRLGVELHCANPISEAKVPIIRNPSPAVNCYDRNKQVSESHHSHAPYTYTPMSQQT